MKPDPLDDLINDYARQPLPSSPTNLTAQIRAEIDRRRSRSFWTRIVPMLGWRELSSEPRLAILALGCALVIGISPAVLLAKSHAQQRLARRSIHFNVFSAPSAAHFATLAPERGSLAHPPHP